ncbi:DUF4124 domain-containing protein [Ralstonia solanacearum]|uniref:DUF4124 domain-containing protein n=1 Tax=Ralstonia solanacearum TaxID=305 RepID=UPI0007D984EF|nr:DUF4124 domain-containing protein [Ralstonia solanacearum]
MRNIITLGACLAILTSGAHAQTVNRCAIKGRTVFTDQPCSQAMDAPPLVHGSDGQRSQEMAAAASRNRAAEEQLARQHDERLVQRDREQENERNAMRYQATVVNNECRDLKARRDQILRLPVTQQQLSPWRDTMNDIRKRMSELHC